MNFIIKSLILMALLTLSSRSPAEDLGAFPYPKLGTYRGYIHMEGAPLKIPVSLDMVRVSNESKNPPLEVFLRVMLNGFSGHEYITQVYSFTSYDWSSPLISLDVNENSDGADISLVNGLFSDDAMRLAGEIQTLKGGSIKGRLEAVYMTDDPVTDAQALVEIFPLIPVIPALTGEYSGKCDVRETLLQLESVKVAAATSMAGVPFDGYRVIGRWANRNHGKIVSRAFSHIVYQSFDDVQFDFYNLTLQIPSMEKRCKVTPEGLNCQKDGGLFECKLNRVDSAFSLKGLAKPSQPISADLQAEVNDIAKNPKIDTDWPPKDEQISGRFSGYIYLKERNVFERITMDLNLVGPPNAASGQPSRPFLSSTVKICLGSGRDPEGQFVSFKFDRMKIPSQKPEFFTFLGQGETMIQITQIVGDVIAGNWYSGNYGLVGQFKMYRDSSKGKATFRPPSQGTPFYPQLQGSYTLSGPVVAEPVRLNLQVIPGPPVLIGNVYPFRLLGNVSVTRRYGQQTVDEIDQIVGGAFDPVVGVISLQLASGRHAIGQLREGNIHMYISGLADFQEGINPHFLDEFKRMPESFETPGDH